jgi:FMN phosphatase YigB (HAD superfamily)
MSLGLHSVFSGFLMPDLTGYIKNDSGFYKSYTTGSQNRIFISVGDNYIDDVVFPTSLGFFTVLKSSLPELLTETNPFRRSDILKRYHENIKFPDFADNNIFPTATINRLQELPDVVDKIENSF